MTEGLAVTCRGQGLSFSQVAPQAVLVSSASFHCQGPGETLRAALKELQSLSGA